MSEPQRTALCRRGLDEIFDPLLRSSIGELIEDVRLRGDDAVCDALQKFDGVTLTPEQLRLFVAVHQIVELIGEYDDHPFQVCLTSPLLFF